jgi:hypothetical protein
MPDTCRKDPQAISRLTPACRNLFEDADGEVQR